MLLCGALEPNLKFVRFGLQCSHSELVCDRAGILCEGPRAPSVLGPVGFREHPGVLARNQRVHGSTTSPSAHGQRFLVVLPRIVVAPEEPGDGSEPPSRRALDGQVEDAAGDETILGHEQVPVELLRELPILGSNAQPHKR